MDQKIDKLPPHSPSAEAAVLGCILLEPENSVSRYEEVRERIKDEAAFYETRHQVIWRAMTGLWGENKPLDTVLLDQRLRDTNRLADAGGTAYVAGLPEQAPTASSLRFYVDEVVEKAVTRLGLKMLSTWGSRIDTSGNISDEQMEAFRKDVEHLSALKAQSDNKPPQHLVRPAHFEKAFMDTWFRSSDDAFGRELPFPFPLRIRPSEMTLFYGDNGSGKSSFLSQVTLHLAKQGAIPCVASMEVPGEITMWIMSRQLLGQGPYMERTDANIQKLGKAFFWLDQKMWIYDFKGITNWRDLLDVFTYANERFKCDTFVVDSVMRIGIEDDNYAEQGVAAARFASFAQSSKSHLFLVMHQNKSGVSGKDGIRGSKQWSDNAHNVCRMQRNGDKAEKLEELKEKLKAGAIEQDEFDRHVDKMKKVWDSKFVLSKQRWPGSQQNASRWLYFDYPSLQFLTHPEDTPYSYLV